MTGQLIPTSQFTRDSRVVFFTGAGVSAESGISTFRDPDGLWKKYDPMELASADGFIQNPALVLEWYAWRRKMIRNSKPNEGHISICKIQKLFRNSVVLTQNVDGYHADAGSESIYELHGNIHRHKCFLCSTPVKLKVGDEEKLNYCECGGMVRPDVVWFGESLDMATLKTAFEKVSECDIFMTIGTSTQIYPAAQLPFEAKNSGAFVIEINPEPTPFSKMAHLSLRRPAVAALSKLYEDFHANIS